MTSTAAAAPAAAPPVQSGNRLSRAVADTATIAGRNLLTIVRLPQLLMFSTVQPVIFVLLFRYAFGGAINTGPVRYVDYLMPGVFVQTVAFGAMGTGIGLADDLHKGLIERFRSLPMARAAVLAGRILSDLVRNVFVVALMCAVGFAVGFRVHTDVAAFLSGLVMLLFFGCALSAIFALIGLSVPNAESAQAAGFPLLAPLVFASSAFVPVATMPGWLQAFAEHQPVSVVIDALRALVLGGPTASHVVQTLVWTVALLAAFGPLAVRRYRRAA
ncbi:MAG TPA: ABC transporter permease [Acidimicrobiales bacterium]|nr:ABC transporter permease [Acidimicrobiales bacterium]